MLEHLNEKARNAERVVVLGARGFVGGTLANQLAEKGRSVLALGRQDLDLLTDDAGERLAASLSPTDCLVFISAEAPVKNNAMLERNISMATSVCAAINDVAPAHVIYVSSDAVYADSPEPLTEVSCAQPASLHGVMHLAREVMLGNAFDGPLAIIRPTLIYGASDPHNGYGPNRFRRLAAEGKEIVLFGEGEERRDHILVDDIASLIVRMIEHKSRGILNAATGTVTSFRDIAEMVGSHFSNPPVIKGSPRVGEMPHGGYRPFDPAGTRTAFADFQYTALADGLAKSHKDLARKN